MENIPDVHERTQRLRTILQARGFNAATDEDALELRRAGVDPALELDLPPIPSTQASSSPEPMPLSDLVAPGLTAWFAQLITDLEADERHSHHVRALHQHVADRFCLVRRKGDEEPTLVQTFGSESDAISALFQIFSAHVTLDVADTTRFVVLDSIRGITVEEAGGE